MPTCQKCGEFFRIAQRIEGKLRNLCNRKFCLNYSPFGLHNTRNICRVPLIKYCERCQKPITTYLKSRRFCSLRCQGGYIANKIVSAWKKGEHTGCVKGGHIASPVRSYLFQKHNKKCMICGWSEVNPTTGRIPLTVHHIDGDWSNNKEKNLQLLCPNCHSLTPTYGASNRGKGRKRTPSRRQLSPNPNLSAP
jgi:endogenous inhibitor of DNA gyrase (YacG/DUF329 family)